VAGAGAQQDLRSPDTRDAALASAASDYQDLRSPDTRDAAVTSEAQGYQDLRSPDTRDAAAGVPPSPTPTPTSADTGTDWGDVWIVAGGVLLLVGLGVAALFSRRRITARKARAAIAAG
jgi:hypothetical protein